MADVTGTFTLGPDSGRLVLRTGRSGLAARAGHDLTIEITRWSGQATLPGESIEAATVTAEIDLGSLAVREGTGGAKPLTDKDRRDIENTAKKILGSGDQAVARFTSSRIIPSSSGGAMEGTLVFRGRSEPVRLELMSPAPGRYRGHATVKQTALGITPYTGFFGALKLRDEVNIEFEVDLNRALQE
ncbi:MAG TPA: YceI family protein [Streptosporangiaceae bacterium]